MFHFYIASSNLYNMNDNYKQLIKIIINKALST